ncbi:MAG: GGDEF domain-containing protein [Candidatus Paceibacterota bacterium]|jgi:diguanylate cyclase (GGDEF)-like protein
MNPRESNEPIMPVVPEGAPQEKTLGGASANLESILLEVKRIKDEVEKGVSPTTEELSTLEVGVEETLKLVIEEERNARFDALTGLPNLRMFNEIMLIEMSRLERQRREGYNYPLYAVKIDLDHFKNINDNFGHEAGNLYLQFVSKHMRAAVRDTDTLARVGGDEFVILMPELDSGNVEQVKERLLGAVLKGSAEAKAELMSQRPGLAVQDGDGNISASMGFELFDGHETSNEFLEHADYYSYVAKAAGKNAVVSREMAAELDPKGDILKRFTASKKD